MDAKYTGAPVRVLRIGQDFEGTPAALESIMLVSTKNRVNLSTNLELLDLFGITLIILTLLRRFCAASIDIHRVIGPPAFHTAALLLALGKLNLLPMIDLLLEFPSNAPLPRILRPLKPIDNLRNPCRAPHNPVTPDNLVYCFDGVFGIRRVFLQRLRDLRATKEVKLRGLR